ncbi:LD-carboxypeptidase [candidate division KSB1 bacterium]
MIKPPRLRKSDTIGIIAPGSPVEKKKLRDGIGLLESHGYRIKNGKHVLAGNGYLAGSDIQRIDDLHEMFLDPAVRAVLCARGGYGSGRLLDLVDFSVIRDNPKIFSGYSDITALQCAILRKTGLVTFSGPMVAPDFGGITVGDITFTHFRDLVSGDENAGILSSYSDSLEVICSGKAEGMIVCGCLSLITSIAGTPYEPDFRDAILVLEDIGEEPYRLDRALNTLKLHGIFEKLSGLVLGKFVDCGSTQKGSEQITIREIVKPLVERYSIPAMMNLSYGHVKNMITIPLGIRAEIDTDNRLFRLTENPVN